MAIKNKYYYRSKISERKFRELVRYFSLDFTASDTARLTGLSVRSVNTIFLKIRQRIAENCEQLSPVEGIVEVDESYFGARRIRHFLDLLTLTVHDQKFLLIIAVFQHLF